MNCCAQLHPGTAIALRTVIKTKFMKMQKFLLAALILLITSVAATAQVSSDSMAVLKQQKQSLALSNKINENKMKLAKLENSLQEKQRDVENTSAAAQKSANENSDAANKLSSDPQDKALARRADKAGNEARKNAKRARIAADDLADLKKEIASLQNKIAEDESKLATNPVSIPAPATNNK